MGGWWLVLGMVCGCGGHPDWPSPGEVDAAWVEEALAWRARANVRQCPEVAEAVDALTLGWIAQSEDVVVRIEQADWAVLEGRADWVKPLVQLCAYEQLTGQTPHRLRTTRRLRRQIILTHPLYPEDRRALRQAARKQRKKATEAA